MENVENPEVQKENDVATLVAAAISAGIITAVVGSAILVSWGMAKSLDKFSDISGAAFFSSVMAEMGGGSKASGGDGMVGGVRNLALTILGSIGLGAGVVVAEQKGWFNWF